MNTCFTHRNRKFLESHFTPLALLFLSIFLFPSCKTLVKSQQREDPLIGKIVSGHTEKELSYEQLIGEALNSQVIYLSEKHDNTEHHALQLKILEELIRQGKQPSIGFEFFSTDQSSYLLHYTEASNSSHGHGSSAYGSYTEKSLRRVLGWEKRSDEEWNFYFKLIEFAKNNQLPAFGADLPQGVIMRLTKKGASGISRIEKTFLSDSEYEDAAYREMMVEKFTESHCGWSNKDYLDRLYQTWVARNDAMAASIVRMMEDYPDRPVVLIVGGGHTEYNMGVYERVAALTSAQKKSIRQSNISFQEISVNPAGLKEYLSSEKKGGRDFSPVADYLWFTQRASYEDPCEIYKDILNKGGKK